MDKDSLGQPKPKMNLIEELAKRIYLDFGQGECGCTWEELPAKFPEEDPQNEYKQYPRGFIPILSKWLDSVENPYQEVIDIYDNIRFARSQGFDKAIAALKAALNKGE